MTTFVLLLKSLRRTVSVTSLTLIALLPESTAKGLAQISPHGELSVTCTDCHKGSSWKDTSGIRNFDHSRTTFPLTGQHAGVACSACHPTILYAAASAACSECHLSDYRAVENPSHASAGFSTDCAQCHSTEAWRPSSWFHENYFPVSAGSTHPPGKWSTCNDCHTVPNNFSVFICTNCHEHVANLMDAKHGSVIGYQYISTACYRCHPRGTSG